MARIYPNLRATGSIANGAAGTVNITGPTCDAGDVLIAALSGGTNTSFGLPGGWTPLSQRHDNTTAQSCIVAWKLATVADSGASFAFTGSATNLAGVILSFKNPKPGQPVDDSGITYHDNASGDNVVFNDYTPVEGGRVVMFAFYNSTPCAYGTPTGMTVDVGPTVGADLAATATQITYFNALKTASGAIGAATAASNSTTDTISVGATLILAAWDDAGAGGSAAIAAQFGQKTVPGRALRGASRPNPRTPKDSVE